MSGINGDKSRYHRERKQKLAKRKRNRELMKSVTSPGKSAPARSTSKPSPVSE